MLYTQPTRTYVYLMHGSFVHMTAIYAGAAKRAITPDLASRPVFLAGFQTNRRAAAVHDDLYARALSIRLNSGRSNDNGVDTFVLAVCDLIGIPCIDC